jgi:hypothetical protein
MFGTTGFRETMPQDQERSRREMRHPWNFSERTCMDNASAGNVKTQKGNGKNLSKNENPLSLTAQTRVDHGVSAKGLHNTYAWFALGNGFASRSKNYPERIISLKLPLSGFYEKNMMQRSLRINSDFADIGTLENNKIAGKKQQFYSHLKN